MAPSKIDVHHHIIPPQLTGHAEGMIGWKAPEWTLEADTAFSESIGVKTRIFSVSVPGVTFIKDPEESGRVARELNEYCAKIRDNDPTRCGFFTTVPDLRYTSQVLAELKHAYNNLNPDGVTLFTSYGETDVKYLGHEDFVPVWEELNVRHAVVLVHPCDRGENMTLVHPNLPGPAFDWPHETGRTAIDLILNHRLEQYPNVRIILSHGGGTLPSLIRRATIVSTDICGAYMTADDLYTQAKKFYFDVALSCSEEVLPMILKFAPKGHLLFGSDYPHATEPFSKMFNDFIDTYPMSDEKREEVYDGAAKVLFPRLKN